MWSVMVGAGRLRHASNTKSRPPPAYDAVMTLNKDDESDPNKEEDTELPSYEAAVRHLQVAGGNGYV
ncbi:hypothetical protein NQ317_000811 [Molorchus minor]|uniref:Uncharacterized protein n=1 Tax=Molorchus minor TaxID=1323400 RepID=A0ABQ9J4X0_9CUCU|nr:hypothetical protein NQ317_000811 [Molorchus minor]